MEVWNIVEYIDRQQIVCAVVVEVKNQRLRLLSETNKEVNLAGNRLLNRDAVRVDPALGRDGLVAHLKELARRRQALCAEVDVAGLWELLSPEQEWVDLDTMAALCFSGAPTDDQRSAVMRALFADRLYFKFAPGRFFPNSAEQVALLRRQRAEEARRQRLVEQGSRWLMRLGAEGRPADGDEAAEVADILKRYFLFGKQSPEYALAKAILARSRLERAENLFEVLVKAGIFSADENLELLRFGMQAEFPESVERQAAAIVSRHAEKGFGDRRRDLTGLRLMTIDGLGTLDFDDAISLEVTGAGGYRLGIHIADVGHFVAKEDAVDVEARQRASSIYMPDQKISMLPPVLAEAQCSLKAGALRPAISTLVTLDAGFELVDYEIVPSVVRVSDQLTYHDVNLSVETDPRLKALMGFAAAFRRRRLSEGAVQISLPELSIWLDEEGRVHVGLVDRESAGRMLVAEIMILANWLTARMLDQHGLPAVFRSQPEPRQRLYEGDRGSLFQNWMQRRHLSRFVLGHAPERHAGLGLDMYVTATSPIRKYVDLVTQRQVRAALGLEEPYAAEEIDALIQQLEVPMSQVARVQYLRHRYWLLRHLETLVGGKAEATVLMKRRNGVQVLLNDFLIECDVATPPAVDLKPEDLVQVTFQQVDARADRIVLSLG